MSEERHTLAEARAECEDFGHSWSEIRKPLSKIPVQFVCDNCGMKIRVTTEESK